MSISQFFDPFVPEYYNSGIPFHPYKPPPSGGGTGIAEGGRGTGIAGGEGEGSGIVGRGDSAPPRRGR